jgi:hypothetical protein
VAGAALVAVGGLGTWIRATTTPVGTTTPLQVATVVGRSESGGWVLLAVGAVTLAAAFAWRSRAARVRAIAPGVSVIAVILASVRLGLIDGRSARMAQEAATGGSIDVYHVGFGWGAWLLLVGTVLLMLSLLAGVLRELDLRRAP